ncbi:MAG TPA: FAD-dependent oxidoreductase [Mycobacterium sp.]|nr:FAD-dependent oxidoreductase [Mycobacterium sp.]
MPDRDRQPAGDPTGASLLAGSPPAPPQLSAAQFDRMTAYGVQQPVELGDIVFRPGDVDYDLILVDSAWIEIVSPATGEEPESVVARYGPGGFLGELNFLTGQTAYLMARVTETGRIHRITRQQFWRLMATEPDLSDILLRTFLARRDLLRGGPAARAVVIIGSELSADSLALRTFAARQRLAHLWLDADSGAGRALAESEKITGADLPAVITGRHVLRRATTEQMASALGLVYRHTGTKPVDLTVIGSGPAGLGAAVYGASEGLDTIALDATGVGGQAAASSRIENYLGFPSGLSGQELTQRAALQAMKFGAQLSSPCRVVDLDTGGQHLTVMLSDGTAIESRAVLIATGVRYNALPLERWADFEGAGIYYAATELESRACRTEPVTVVGGANSAGQAALFLASRGCQVTLAVRRSDVAATMSSYLLARLRCDPRVTIRVHTEVTGLFGSSSLESITLTDNSTGQVSEQICAGLFCFIGARPETDWLRNLALDRAGFIRTDAQLDPEELGATWTALGRPPLPFETSMPTVFAAGDVRVSSVKRVASAVGEGASAVRSIHAALGPHT